MPHLVPPNPFTHPFMKNTFLPRGRLASLILILIAALGLAAPASHAAEGRWTQAQGQGLTEFFVDAQGMRLYITCNKRSGSQSTVSLTNVQTLQDVPSFRLQVAGTTVDGPLDTGSSVGMDNYKYLLQALRTSDVAASFAGKTVRFPKTGAAQVLPSGRGIDACAPY